MKIAVNTRLLIPGKMEGIGWFIYETMKRITTHHPEHEFYFFFDRKYSGEFIFSGNIRPLTLLPPARHPFLFYWWFEYAVARALKKCKADLFLSPDGFLSLSAKTKSVSVVHDLSYLHLPEHISFLEYQYYKMFMPLFIKKAGRIATVSESSKKDIISKYQVNPGKIDVVYSAAKETFRPIDRSRMQEIKNRFSGGSDYFLYVGALQPRKNISRLFLAFDEFKKSNPSSARLLIAGRKAWQTREMLATYDNMTYKNDVTFLDYVPLDELVNIIASSLALVYISVFEGFGVPILEGMQCDVPVITSNLSSMPEVAGNAALLIDPFSVESIANAMTLLYKNEALRQQLINKGRTQREKFSWDDTSQRLWSCVEKVLEKN